jgi:hypothetical protein
MRVSHVGSTTTNATTTTMLLRRTVVPISASTRGVVVRTANTPATFTRVASFGGKNSMAVKGTGGLEE